MSLGDHKYSGFVIGVLAVILFSAKAVMVKLAYQFNVDPVSLLLLRMLFSMPFYIGISVYNFQDIRSKWDRKVFGSLLLFGLLGYYLASYFDFLGLVYIKASLERVILFIYPTIVLFLSWVFLKSKITKHQVVAILITYIGVVFIFIQDPDLIEGSNIGLGASLIFLSALTYAAYLVGSGYIIPIIGASIFTSLAMLVSCVGVVIHYSLVADFDLFQFDLEVYLLGFTMAILSTVLPSYMVSFAIKKIGAPTFSILGSFGPVSTILLAYMFLGEELTLLQGVGVLVVLGGVYFVSKKSK